MEQARDDLAHELASGTPNYANAVAGAERYCPLIAQVLRSLEQAVRETCVGTRVRRLWVRVVAGPSGGCNRTCCTVRRAVCTAWRAG